MLLEATLKNARFHVCKSRQLYETQEISEQRATYESEMKLRQEEQARREAAQKRIDDLDP